MKLEFENRFVQELPADPDNDPANSTVPRQVFGVAYSLVDPLKPSSPKLVSASTEAASLIDLSVSDIDSAAFVDAFSGKSLLQGMQGHAMCYGGHQFGNWAGQLGDGRAINLGEVKNRQGQHWSLQLKGSGPTPYSRTADGLAVLRSSIREFVCSEAMYHLGVPTTRALSLMTTGDQVMRDMLYNGNAAYEPGAVVCRMAPSFIRFGSFQIFSSRKEYAELQQLTDFTIRHYYPELLIEYEVGSPEIVIAFLNAVCERTVSMIVEWMRVGFVHGVMNTDNMSIHGLTIDYGPYGWLDDYNPDWTPNTTDASQKRYRFGQQANIALWNCYQLANALFPLVDDAEPLEQVLERFQSSYAEQWQRMMASKLGLLEVQEGDGELFLQLERVLTSTETDMTRFYRALARDDVSYECLLEADVFYDEAHDDAYRQSLDDWLSHYQSRLDEQAIGVEERRIKMNRTNPKYVFRNYLAQQAIDKSEAGDHSMVNELLEVLRRPYEEQEAFDHYAAKRPDWARTKVGCSMLSCSS